MRLKALLLGSASALAVAGSAQAADLTIAEPVDYVRVCDAFGSGYWYIPGTDTCLKIGGFARFDVLYGPSVDDPDDLGSEDGHYNFKTSWYFNLTAQSMTDWGPLKGFIGFFNGAPDTAYVQLGPLKAGHDLTTFATFLPLNTISGDPYSGYYNADFYQDQIGLTWAMNGFGFSIFLEETTEFEYDGSRLLSRRTTQEEEHYSAMPDVIAALTFSSPLLDGKVAGVWSEFGHDGNSGWAVTAGVVIKLDSVSPGDKLLLKAAYGVDIAQYVTGSWRNEQCAHTTNGCTTWSALGSFAHYFSPSFKFDVTVSYGHWAYNGGGSDTGLQTGFDLSYSPATDMWITPQVRWINDTDWGTDWLFDLRLQRGF